VDLDVARNAALTGLGLFLHQAEELMHLWRERIVTRQQISIFRAIDRIRKGENKKEPHPTRMASMRRQTNEILTI
jgi:hypothetical protein